jgi:hypothetical protein
VPTVFGFSFPAIAGRVRSLGPTKLDPRQSQW